MLALEYNEKITLREDYPDPIASQSEALVRVRQAGICRTDLEITKGYMNFTGIIGHEFVGTVIEGPDEWMSKRVVGEINCPCGNCNVCSMGLGRHCPNRTVIGIDGRDGAFAEMLTIPIANLHAIPPNVSNDEAIFTEPLAAALQIARQVRFTPTDNVVVLGDGKLGLLIAMALRHYVRDLMLVGKHPQKMSIAQHQGVRAIPLEQFEPRGDTHFVIDATGSRDGFITAMRTVLPTGTIVLKSTFADSVGVNLAPVVVNEITVIGSRCGPFDDALEFLAEKEIDVIPLISERYTLSKAPAAIKAAGNSENVKIIIDV